MNKLNKSQKTKLDSFSKTSTKIRYLTKLNWSRSEIKNELKILYQHVRNVQITPIQNPTEKF